MHSIRWNVLTLAFGGALSAYGTAQAIAPSVVSGIPHWILTALVAGTMLGPIFSSFGALISQPEVRTPQPPSSNDFHQGNSP